LCRTGLTMCSVQNSDIPGYTLLGLVEGHDDIDSTITPGSYQYKTSFLEAHLSTDFMLN